MWSASLAFIPLVFSWLASANRFFVSPDRLLLVFSSWLWFLFFRGMDLPRFRNQEYMIRLIGIY